MVHSYCLMTNHFKLLEHLEVGVDRMRDNLLATKGFV